MARALAPSHLLPPASTPFLSSAFRLDDPPARGLDTSIHMAPGKHPPASAPVRSSSAVEDYLEQILELINTKGYARVVDIAAGLGISQASVTNMVQRLDAEGLLKYERYRGLALTTAGETLARNITRRHQLLTDFLKALGLPEDVIHHDVEGMEHHISPPTLRAIEALTDLLSRHPDLAATVRAAATAPSTRRRERAREEDGGHLPGLDPTA